jgi:hypothetical protein
MSEVIAICYGQQAVEDWEHSEKPLATEGTFSTPGSAERIEVYRRRAFFGQQIFHPDDANYECKLSTDREGVNSRSPYLSKLQEQIVNTTTWSRR